jgi:hypothetical protein
VNKRTNWQKQAEEGVAAAESIKLFSEKELPELKKLLAQMQERENKILDLYNVIFIGSTDKPPLKTQFTSAQTLLAEITRLHNKVETFHDKIFSEDDNGIILEALIDDWTHFINEEYLKVQTFSAELFGDEEDKASKGKSLKQQFNELKAAGLAQLKDQNDLFLIEKNKIEGLLAGATTVGLSEKFEDARKAHEIKEKDYQYAFLAVIALLFVVPLVSIWSGYVTFSVSTISDLGANIAKLIPFEAPLIWLGVMANRRMHQEARLKEEYLHKFVIAKTFIGLQKEAKSFDDANILAYQLLSHLIETTAQNPSPTLENLPPADSPLSVVPVAEIAKGLGSVIK